MKKRLLLVGLLLGAMMIFTACNGDSADEDVVQVGDQVSVEYEGRLSNGEVFDASANHGQPLTFTAGVGQMIPGFDAAVLGMAVGDEKTVTIPAAEAYGEAGVPGPEPGEYIIPPNEDITFDITVVDIVRPGADEE